MVSYQDEVSTELHDLNALPVSEKFTEIRTQQFDEQFAAKTSTAIMTHKAMELTKEYELSDSLTYDYQLTEDLQNEEFINIKFSGNGKFRLIILRDSGESSMEYIRDLAVSDNESLNLPLNNYYFGNKSKVIRLILI